MFDFDTRFEVYPERSRRDPQLARWVVPDPAMQFSNPYLGIGNNPVINIDPDGEFIVLPALIGAGMGVLTNGLRNTSNGNRFFRGAEMAAGRGALFSVISAGITGAPNSLKSLDPTPIPNDLNLAVPVESLPGHVKRAIGENGLANISSNAVSANSGGTSFSGSIGSSASSGSGYQTTDWFGEYAEGIISETDDLIFKWSSLPTLNVSWTGASGSSTINNSWVLNSFRMGSGWGGYMVQKGHRDFADSPGGKVFTEFLLTGMTAGMGALFRPASGISTFARSSSSAAKLSTNGVKLAKQLASESQVANGAVKTIGRNLRVGETLAQRYGGKASHWVKQTSSNYSTGRGIFETHWYHNVNTRMSVEFKTKLINGVW